MSDVITTCTKCNAKFKWDIDCEEMPDCPRCGHNPKRVYRQADVPTLIEMLRSSDHYISSSAAAELGNRGDLRAVQPLIDALGNAGPQQAAIVALGKLRSDQAVTPLIGLLKSGQGLSGLAAEALLETGTRQAVTAVAASLEVLQQGEIYELMCFLIRKGETSTEFLINALSSKSPYVRHLAVTAIGHIGDRRAIELLMPLLKDSNASIVSSASEALSLLGQKPADR